MCNIHQRYIIPWSKPRPLLESVLRIKKKNFLRFDLNLQLFFSKMILIIGTLKNLSFKNNRERLVDLTQIYPPPLPSFFHQRQINDNFRIYVLIKFSKTRARGTVDEVNRWRTPTNKGRTDGFQWKRCKQSL